MHIQLKRLFFITVITLLYCRAVAQVLVIAHRGASEKAPENTLLAFEEAIKTGADYIETDVHQTKDGKLVIMHDLSVNRTCEINDALKKKTGDKNVLIKNISLNDFLSLKIKGEAFSPPTLDSAIKLINGRCKLLIELKKGSIYYPGIESNVLEIIKRNNAERWVNIIHSFDKATLFELQKQKTGIKLQKLIVFRFPLGSFNYSTKVERDNFSNWQGVNCYYRFTSRRLIKKLHSQGKTVYSWTVNERKWAKKLINRGVDGIITDNPAMIKEILAGK